MNETCGCRVDFDEHNDAGFIVYCPLHAAAPDLLEVARMALAAVEMDFESAPPKFGPHDLTDAARAAIAKAEGKT